MNKKHLLLPATMLLLAASAPMSLAAKDSKATAPIQTAERQLKDLSECIHRGRHAAADLVIECQQVNELMGGEIDFVGTDIIPILPDTAEGMGPDSYIPPRPKYINLHMAQLTGILPLLQSEIVGIKAPDPSEADKISPYTAEMQLIWADVQKHFANLGPLTSNQPYDSTGIVTEAKAIDKDLAQIDKLRKSVYESYRHDKNPAPTADAKNSSVPPKTNNATK